MAVSLKTGPVVADKYGNETAIQITPCPANKIEHVRWPDASNLPLYPRQCVDTAAIAMKLPTARREILVLFSNAPGNAMRTAEPQPKCRPADLPATAGVFEFLAGPSRRAVLGAQEKARGRSRRGSSKTAG